MEKKTVGMITIYKKNYGAFLQAYALQKKLIECGYAPEIIRYDYYKDRSIMDIPLSLMKNPTLFMKKIAIALIRYNFNKRRQAVFNQSIKNNLSESKEYYKHYSKLKRNPPIYDIYLSGSDQVFNPRLTPHTNKSRLLCFASGNKASYAASAGNVIFSEQEDNFLKRELNKFNHISVREQKLCDYISSNYGINSERNIDPTLLLSKNDWLSFSEAPEYLMCPYIFYYRVGNSNSLKETAEKLSKDMGIPVFCADGHEKFVNQIERKNTLSPEEWVGAIAKARYVVTNSFHGTAFSINLHKNIRVVLPELGADRIIDLVKNCQLERILTEEMIEDCELSGMYLYADEYLKIERDKAIKYLKTLSVNDNEVS